MNQTRYELNEKLRSNRNGKQGDQVVFDIISNETYQINVIKNVNNSQLQNEKHKIIKQYRKEFKDLLIHKVSDIPENRLESRRIYNRMLRLTNETTIYLLKGLNSNKMYVGSTCFRSLNDTLNEINSHYKYFKETNRKKQLMFEIIGNENYEIVYLKTVNKLEISQEKRKTIKEYKRNTAIWF